MSTELSPLCKAINGKILGLKAQKVSVQKLLSKASTGEKADFANEIKELNKEIGQKKKELDDCIKKNPFVPPPKPEKPKPNPCKPQEIAKLKAALNKQIQNAVAPLQKLLQKASSDQKADLVLQMKEISSDIRKNSQTAKDLAAKTKEYAHCIQIEDGFPALNAIFKGTATMTTSNSKAPGPFKRSVNIGLLFSDWDRRDVEITSFPDLSVSYDTHSPVGEVTTTVSLRWSTGKFDPPSNSITFDLDLFFAHDTDWAGDSTLDITLHTWPPLTAAGKITVQGSSNFKGGYLDEDTCSLSVVGTISPHPLSK